MFHLTFLLGVPRFQFYLTLCMIPRTIKVEPASKKASSTLVLQGGLRIEY